MKIKNKIISLLLATLILVSSLIIPVSADSSSDLFGTWGATIDDIYGEMSFYSDGTGLVDADDGTYENFTWYLTDDETIILHIDGNSIEGYFTISGDTMHLSLNGETQEFTKMEGLSLLERALLALFNSDAFYDFVESWEEACIWLERALSEWAMIFESSPLLGTWGATIDDIYGVFCFRSDGTGFVAADDGTYEDFTWYYEDDETVVCYIDGSRMEYGFDVSGDTLYMLYYDELQEFSRESEHSFTDSLELLFESDSFSLYIEKLAEAIDNFVIAISEWLESPAFSNLVGSYF